MAAAYPPGGTFFQTLKKSFADVPVDEAKDSAVIQVLDQQSGSAIDPQPFFGAPSG